MKKEYLALNIEIIFTEEDVIRTSGETNGQDVQGMWQDNIYGMNSEE